MGYNDNGTVTNSFWDTITSGMETSDGGTGKSTTEMQSQSTYTTAPANWDFVTTVDDPADWFINEGSGYPVHSLTAYGDINIDNYINLHDFMLLSKAWQTTSGDTNYNPLCDLSGDSTINISDLMILADNWITITPANAIPAP